MDDEGRFPAWTHRMELIDRTKNSQLAAGDQKIIGALSHEERVLVGLIMQPVKE